MRGKADTKEYSAGVNRITPACAGKRTTNRRKGKRDGDHPRVCGEKRSRANGLKRAEGSPPRVRGKVLCFTSSSDASGITPACAGKRIIIPSVVITTWDHPRVCGEKAVAGLVTGSAAGSPPRVRGKDDPHNGNTYIYGITPACAGKSHP